MFEFIKKIFRFKKIKEKKEEKESPLYEIEEEEKETSEIHSIWDYLKFVENTQSFHLKTVLDFNEWISMEEIRRRIYDLFRADYKNERSLYPYLKTLVDTGLVESINVGGKRKWRKKELLIKLIKRKKEKEEKIELRVS